MDRFGRSKAYAARESDYRDRALKLYPWICARCGREFRYSNISQLTVHHKDHNHDNNPPDGSNWELLCLYCHDYEHSKYVEHTLYGSEASLREREPDAATHNPFEKLKALMAEKK